MKIYFRRTQRALFESRIHAVDHGLIAAAHQLDAMHLGTRTVHHDHSLLTDPVTGRMVILPRPRAWTPGEARIHGLVLTTVGLVFAIKSLVDGLVLILSTSSI